MSGQQRVRARHDVAPLEYRVNWKQFDAVIAARRDRSWVDGLVERVSIVLGEKQAAEVAFELASGRCPRFIPGGR